MMLGDCWRDTGLGHESPNFEEPTHYPDEHGYSRTLIGTGPQWTYTLAALLSIAAWMVALMHRRGERPLV
jgi:hypothetical protein